jgi:hypothetical protein
MIIWLAKHPDSALFLAYTPAGKIVEEVTLASADDPEEIANWQWS